MTSLFTAYAVRFEGIAETAKAASNKMLTAFQSEDKLPQSSGNDPG